MSNNIHLSKKQREIIQKKLNTFNKKVYEEYSEVGDLEYVFNKFIKQVKNDDKEACKAFEQFVLLLEGFGVKMGWVDYEDNQ